MNGAAGTLARASAWCGEDGQANKSKGGGGGDSEEHEEQAAAAVRQKLTL